MFELPEDILTVVSLAPDSIYSRGKAKNGVKQQKKKLWLLLDSFCLPIFFGRAWSHAKLLLDLMSK